MSEPSAEREKRFKQKKALAAYASAAKDQLLIPRLELRGTFPQLTKAFDAIDFGILKQKKQEQEWATINETKENTL